VLWVKSFHIVFMVAWFAGLFYLPRLYVYHCEAAAGAEYQRFCIMERRLYAIMTIGMIGTWLFALWLLWLVPGYLQQGWLHAKLALAVLLSGYHGWLKTHMKAFAAGTNTRDGRFYRLINEVPVLFLIAMVVLVVVKPF
jgi:protoporphyrinogen IX oxidase